MIDTDKFKSMVNLNEEFKSSGKFFDGSIQLNIGNNIVWMKVFMGQIIYIDTKSIPFGYTFAIKGTIDEWVFVLNGAKNRFKEAITTGKILIEGNKFEFNRIIKAVHGLVEVLRDGYAKGIISLGEK